MRRCGLLILLSVVCTGCGLLPGGGGIGSLIPTSDLPIAATFEGMELGALDTGAFVMQTTIVGTVVDQYGTGMAGVVMCYGPSEEDAVAIGVTDSGGAYTATPPQSFSGTGGNLVWAYLPLYRFEPDRVQVSAILVGENTQDFTAYPSIYPVPPERDCR